MSQFDFSNVASREINTERTSTFVLTELEGRPRLHGVFAGERNKALRAAIAKANATVGQGRSESAEFALATARENVRALFPKHVLTGWDDIKDAKGKPVDYSPEACEAFLRALPDWILQGVIEHFGNPLNFAGDELPAKAIEAVAKN